MKLYFSAWAVLLLLVAGGRAQTTAFTYQGQLNNSNAPVTGAYDFRFQIYNANSNVVAGPLTNAPVGVTNGLFTVTLDFGTGVFDGSTRTLEIGVRSYGDTNAYVVLSPRQPLTSVPYAIQSLNSSNAVALTAPLPATDLTGIIPNSLLSTNVAVLSNNVVFAGSVTATNFIGSGSGLVGVPGTSLVGIITGNGSGLTSVPGTSLTGIITGNGFGVTNLQATNLVGTIPDARQSTNVALQTNINLYFAGSVTASNFTGAGHGLTNVPGAFFWVTVSNTSVQMLPNTGYIVTNTTAPATLTLPASPAVGDVYKVAAVGAGGWIIAQNANQAILSGNLSGSVGQNWKTSAPSAYWTTIASSADGTKLAAAVSTGYIWTSTNSGATWTQQTGSGTHYWSSIASSADGTKLVATVGYTIFNASQQGAIYTSTDSGVSWTPHTSSPLSSSLSWSSVASSADGTKIVAAVHSGQLYLSGDSGSSWAAVSGSSGYLWSSVASSSSGTNLVAVEGNGSIFVFTNSSSGWTQRISGNTNWMSVTMSSDGTRLVATGNSGQVFASADSGVTWNPLSTTASGQLTAVTSSADGSRLAITSGGSGNNGNINVSSNFGSTWTQPPGAPVLSWADIASSADGSLLAAAAYGGYIYVSTQSSTTIGTAGYLIGAQHSTIELMYVGNNLFLPLSHEGTIRAY